MDETHKKTRVALYVRVSTEEQVSKWVSIEHQTESLVEYAERNGYVLNRDRHIYVDRGFSGASKSRPALQKLMFDSANDEFDLVLVKKVDRFFRKNLYLLQHVEELVQNGVSFKAVDQGFNVEDTSGKMMLSMLGVIGEMERDLIRDRTISGKVQKAKMGYYVGGGYPKLGYRFERDSRGKKLVVDEEESELVKRIFRLYVEERKTFWEISEMFNGEGIQTKYDKVFAETPGKRKKIPNHWYPTSLGSIITDETYVGKYFYGKNGYRYDRKLWKDVSYVKPRSEWIELPCPRIVDDATFAKAQELIEKNKAMKNNKVSHPFAGLVKCDACGRSYVGYRTCKHTFSYRCWGNSIYKTHVESRCFNKQVSEKYLFEHVWRKIEQVFENPKSTLEDYYKSRERDDRIEDYSKEYAELTKKAEKYSNALKNVYKDLYLCESELEKEMKQETLKTLERELETLNRRKAELSERVAKLRQVDESKESLGKIVREYRQAFDSLTYDDKIGLIREFTERIVVYDWWKIVVNFRFWNHSESFTHMEFEIRKDSA